MGLRVLDSNWEAAGDCVDHCCAKTYEVWREHWEDDEANLSDRLGLRALVEGLILHRITSKSIQSRAETRVGGRIALYRKLPIEVVLNLIVSYCGRL